ncbi:MAG: alkaline shock response membrane anchor protein AmaP [Actinomycetota bacterium]|nr:alkaline shock response membrane anchor protein AmaP [Actinomycetota bacterium]
MRVFNRIVVILLLVGLIALGAYTVVYSFELFGYQLSNLSSALNGFTSGVEGFVSDVEDGNLPALTIAILAAVALLGLILLFMEFKPRRPRRVRMQGGTYVVRDIVKDEVSSAAEETPNVLGSTTTVAAKRRPGAKVKLRADVRRGQDKKAIKSDLRERVQQHLARTGVPLGRLKLKLVESDPRQTKTRVQ